MLGPNGVDLQYFNLTGLKDPSYGKVFITVLIVQIFQFMKKKI